MSNSINVRIDNERKKQIEAVAALEGISVSDLIRNATIAYLTKDTSSQGQESDIERIDKKVDFLSKLFINFTEYSFAGTKSFGDMSDAQKIILAEEWQERSKSIIEAFQIGGLNNE